MLLSTLLLFPLILPQAGALPALAPEVHHLVRVELTASHDAASLAARNLEVVRLLSRDESPGSSAEVIVLEAAADPVSGITLEWTAEMSYFRYRVQSSTNLVEWVDEPDAKYFGDTAGQNFVFNQAMTGDGQAKKFYRVMRSPQ